MIKTNYMNKHKQAGFVSILVTMILMVVTSLLVLSFAYLARQNMNRNLNQQLSTQAFYAAESGVNDTVAKLKANPSSLGDIKDCNNTDRVGTKVIGDSTLNVSYTCVLVDQSPTDLKYDSISTDSSTVVRVKTGGASTIKLSWQDAGGDNGFAPGLGNKFYLPQNSFIATQPSGSIANFPNHTGILRATVTPAGAIGNDDALRNASRSFFLYPQANPGSNNAGTVDMNAPSADGAFVSGECNSQNTAGNYPRFCNATITNAPADFYLRLKAVYKPVAVTVQALDGSVPQAISGAQAVVDATGKAQDVLRRIQVRVPLQPSFVYPEFAVESANSICKRMSVWPGGAIFINPDHSLYTDSNNPGQAPANNASKDQTVCQLPGGNTLNF